MGAGCEGVRQGRNADSQREERKRRSESTKIEGSGGALVKKHGSTRKERHSALCVFEYKQSPWINQAESWRHRGHLLCLALFRLLHSPAG